MERTVHRGMVGTTIGKKESFTDLDFADDVVLPGAASMRIQSIHCIPSKSRLLLYFNVSLTFDKTLIKQFCYFFCKNRHFLGYKCVSIQKWT